MPPAPKQGWALPGSARKWHYFTDTCISLCRKWMFGNTLAYDDSPPKDNPQEECVTCTRKWHAVYGYPNTKDDD